MYWYKLCLSALVELCIPQFLGEPLPESFWVNPYLRDRSYNHSFNTTNGNAYYNNRKDNHYYPAISFSHPFLLHLPDSPLGPTSAHLQPPHRP